MRGLPAHVHEELMKRARREQGLPEVPRHTNVGRKFGRLVVTGPAAERGFWLCRCSACGSIQPYRWTTLLTRANPTCGCIRLSDVRANERQIWRPSENPTDFDMRRGPGRNIQVDRIGRTFGQLTVVSYIKDTGFYLCLCGACGQSSPFTWGALVKRGNPTCGCDVDLKRAPVAYRPRPEPKRFRYSEAEALEIIRRRRERQYEKYRVLVPMNELNEPETPDFRPYQLRTAEWLGDGCRWVRCKWPQTWTEDQ